LGAFAGYAFVKKISVRDAFIFAAIYFIGSIVSSVFVVVNAEASPAAPPEAGYAGMVVVVLMWLMVCVRVYQTSTVSELALDPFAGYIILGGSLAACAAYTAGAILTHEKRERADQ
jgi:hypothetical protein